MIQKREVHCETELHKIGNVHELDLYAVPGHICTCILYLDGLNSIAHHSE